MLRSDRITDQQWKQATKARYLDLRDGLKSDVRDTDMDIKPDNKELLELRILDALAKLHGVNPKDF